jgi:hypothetical protein
MLDKTLVDDVLEATLSTVALYAAVAPMPFTPAEASAALVNYAREPRLWGKYGLTDSYNLDYGDGWYCPTYIGIDKGITLVMLANYQDGLVWRLFNGNASVKAGLTAIGVERR